ncbi:MAG: A/G-specific adenine glycosylase [Bacteroidales bacterium]|nr:MAG: A/G-specific adenine glycosylase [Bacteroidales bacterium]
MQIFIYLEQFFLNQPVTMNFSGEITAWYISNKRELPWRETADPYKIWVSEIILQQTRVVQGLGYYERFIKAFPDVHSLARATTDQVMRLWQGLGYYSRAVYLHEAAQHIMKELGGEIPDSYRELIRIRGIGEYTAAAIASIAFQEPVPLIDGNVFRVIARLFNLPYEIGTAKAKKVTGEIAERILDPKRPGLHNQAMMEFGALHCVIKNPDCNNCILRNECLSFLNNNVKNRPVKKKRVKKAQRYFNYLVVRSGNSILMRKRNGKDIWKYLYDFPVIETPALEDPAGIIASEEWKYHFKDTGPPVQEVTPVFKHVLSHQIIHIRFFILQPEHFSGFHSKDYKWVNLSGRNKPAVPKPIHNFLSSYAFKH